MGVRTFGYRLDYLPDGRAVLVHDPAPLTGGRLLSLIVGGSFLLFAVLLGMRTFGITLPFRWTVDSGGIPTWLAAVAWMVFGSLAFSIFAQVLMRRRWIIESGTLTRQTQIRGTPLGWHRTYRLGGVEILHQVWNDEEGVSDSVRGLIVGQDRDTITFEEYDVPVEGIAYGRTHGWPEHHPLRVLHRPQVRPRLPAG